MEVPASRTFRRFRILCACLGTAAILSAQTAPSTSKQQPLASTATTQLQTIDGAKNPEMIPDVVAYRLWLITVSSGTNPTPSQRRRQRAFLSASGLGELDAEAAVPILDRSKSEYNLLIAEFNKLAARASAANQEPDFITFLAKRDALVQSTREALKQALTPQGMAALNGHVQHEKMHMKIAAQEVQ